MTLQARQSSTDVLEVAAGCLAGGGDFFLRGAGRRLGRSRFRSA
jgi:hypothetical protein